eukprot:s140_g36.t1
MSALDAAVHARMAAAAEEKGNKQSSRFRLIADATISVHSIQAVLTKYCELKQEKQLWSLICPPPTGPMSYGWHSKPDGPWLMKVAGLLYDLLAICPNTKLVSKKVVAALKGMEQSFSAEFPHTKHLSKSDLMDKVDVTLRVLLSMMRQLKCSQVLKSRTYRMLSKADQCKMDIMLDRVVLPPELIGNENFEDEERYEGDIYMTSFEGSEKSLEVASAMTSCQLVPVDKQQVKAHVPSPCRASGGQNMACRSVKPLPAIFGRILGQNGSTPVEVGVSQPAKCAASVLALAMNHAPKATMKEQKTGQSKKGTKNAQKASVNKQKKGKCKKDSGKPAKSVCVKKKNTVKASKSASRKAASCPIDSSLSLTYKPGELASQRERYVQEQMDHGGMSKREAMQAWATSLRRAELLKDLSVSELVKRRFAPPGSTTNPFAEQVQRALAAPNVD